VVLDDETVKIDDGRQAIMDREIAFAVSTGLDYWAFVAYEAASSMSAALPVGQSRFMGLKRGVSRSEGIPIPCHTRGRFSPSATCRFICAIRPRGLRGQRHHHLCLERV
jgi:hypothetical protein